MRKSNKIIITVIMAVLCILLKPICSNAALQSNGGTPAKKLLNDWLLEIRQMQATGGGLGLNDTINASNLTSNNKDLDIHMEKNTDYGTLAILSVSSYGNPNKIEDGGTTTGNTTGVVMKLNKEWVSAGCSDLSKEVPRFGTAAARYKNIYTTTYVAKNGDAITETNGWHGSGSSTWIRGKTGGLLRAYSGSIFSYYGVKEDGYSFGDDAEYRSTWASRAIVVVGSGV